jgi:hypothetical protein
MPLPDLYTKIMVNNALCEAEKKVHEEAYTWVQRHLI